MLKLAKYEVGTNVYCQRTNKSSTDGVSNAI